MTLSLRQKQSKFAHMVALLILHAEQLGYEVTLGDAWAETGHKTNSFHYSRLAIDLNLFKDGKYLTSTMSHQPLGLYWKSLDPHCSWGGDWNDGNHYSYGESIDEKS